AVENAIVASRLTVKKEEVPGVSHRPPATSCGAASAHLEEEILSHGSDPRHTRCCRCADRRRDGIRRPPGSARSYVQLSARKNLRRVGGKRCRQNDDSTG